MKRIGATATWASLWIALLSQSSLLVPPVSPASAQQPPSPPPAQPGAKGRSFVNLNNTISTMDGFGAYGDGLSYVMVACIANNGSSCNAQASNIVNFPSAQNGTLSTTLTANAGSGTLTAASGFCKSEMAGSPIYIPGAAVGGGNLLTRIVECIGSQSGSGAAEFSVDPPIAVAPSGTVTIAFGAMALNSGTGWQQSDAGKGIFVGNAAAIGLGALYTISAVNSPTNITLSANVGNVVNNAAISFVWGHDDSAAVSTACNAVLASGLKDLQVPAAHFAPSLSLACYGVKLHGNGEILATNYGLPPATTSAAGFVKEVVVPDNAPMPSPPVRSVVAKRDLTQCQLSGPNPVIVQTGDSLETLRPNQLSGLGTYPGAFQTAFWRQNRNIGPTWRNGGIGGAVVANFDANPAVAGIDVVTSTSTAWLTQVAAVSPCGVTVGFGNNDGTSLSLPALVDSYLKLTGSGSTFTPVPDLIYVTHHPYTRIGNPGSGLFFSEGDDYASGWICSFARVMGRPCIDGARDGEKHLFGYDPGALQFSRRYDVPYNTNNLGLPFKPDLYTPGFSAQFLKTGVNGTSFWNNFTGNTGVTDPRGPFIAFQVGYNADNVVWLFYNSGTNQIGYECDISVGLPGLGCDGPNGAPPVTPSLLSNITVANSGAGGVAVVTASAAVLGANCVAGNTLTVPNAGPTESPPGYVSYKAPLISIIASCDSSTQITLSNAASNTYAAQSGFVLFGNPVTWSNVTDTSSCSNEPFQFEVNFDMLRVWFCTQFQVVYAGPIARSRNAFQPNMFSGGDKPTLTIAGDTNGGTTYLTARPNVNQITYVDAEVSGPSTGAPVSNASYSGPQGGDGVNHNPQGYGARVIQALMDAQDLSLGLSQGLYKNTPTTGFTLTIPNGYATALLTPAGTLATGAVTLPASYPQNQDFVLTSTQTITALTLNANTGQTVNGAPTTLSANSSVRFRLEGTVWYRLQ